MRFFYSLVLSPAVVPSFENMLPSGGGSAFLCLDGVYVLGRMESLSLRPKVNTASFSLISANSDICFCVYLNNLLIGLSLA